MIRILHFAGIINRYDIIDVVLTRLDRSRFQPYALTPEVPRQADAYAEGEAYPTRYVPFAFTRRHYGKMLRALLAEIRRIRPHILHAHHYDENMVASMAVRLARVPCYVIGRHYSNHIYYLTHGLKQKVFLAAEGFCNRTATRITVPTQEVAQLLTERQGVPTTKVDVIPFGLDFRKYCLSSPDAPARLRHQYGLNGKYVALTCGRLNPEKGLEYLLRALPEVRAHHADFRLVIVGSGPSASALRQWSRDLRLDDVVQFVGWRDDVTDWMAAADLVVQPSFCESFCQVLFEALACGTPVIMTPVGAAPEVIGDNERGRLVPLGDHKALAAAMCELIADRRLGQKLGELGRDYIHQHMGADLTARRYEAFYDTALQAASLSCGMEALEV